jgi:hypothetical protein
MSIQELKEAVDRFFSDTSRSPEETREGLEQVADHISMLCETLPEAD